MKQAILKRFLAAWTILAAVCSATAGEVTVEVVEGETASFQTSANVRNGYSATLTVPTGTSRNQVALANAENGSYGYTATVTSSSNSKKTFYAKGLAFTPDKVTLSSTYRSGGNNASTTDNFTFYVAQADEMIFTVGDAARTIQTPTISAAARWNCRVTSGTDVVGASMSTSSATSRTVTVTPKAVGTAVIEVRSGSQTAGSGVLRQRITVVVRNPPQEKAVALTQNDAAQFFFQCQTAGPWHVQLNGASVTAAADTQGDHVSIQRSASESASVNTFNFKVWARRTTDAGQADVVAVTDPAGNSYTYTFTVGRTPAVDVSDGAVALAARVCTSLAQNTWTLVNGTPAVASAVLTENAAGAATVGMTAENTVGTAAASATEITVSNHQETGTNCARGATYTLRVTTLKPRSVTLCDGDAAEIYLHRDTATQWFLTVNGNLVSDGSVLDGNQMRLQLEDAGTDAILTARTRAVGDGVAAHGDLIVISNADGEIYPYRANVLAAREVAVGYSVSVNCMSVTDQKPWSCDLMSGAEGYVSATCTANTLETANYVTTATITGLKMTEGDGAVVAVRNNNYSTGEKGSQGGVYYLKTRVVGVPTIPVNLSAGVTMPVAFNHAQAPADATYAVALAAEGSAAISATDLAAAADGKSFTLNLAAAADAAQGASRLVTVTCNGEEVVKYNVTVVQAITLEQGTVAPGFLYGARTPWTTRSSDETVFTAHPVVYQNLYSAEGVAIKPGDAVSLSYNETLSAGYWGIAIRVYMVHSATYQVRTGTPLTLIIEDRESGHAGGWHVGLPAGERELVYIALADVDGIPTATQVTITPKDGAKGPETFEISNGYHVERISLYVTDSTSDKPTHRLDVARQVLVDEWFDLPAVAWEKDWTASVADPTVVRIAAASPVAAQADVTEVSGAAGTAVRVTGLKVGTTYVAVEQSDVIYIYTVRVLPKSGGTLAPVTVFVGETYTWVLQNERAQATRAWTDDNLVATAALGTNTAGAKTCTVTGMQEGKTTLNIQVGDTVYTAPVTTVRKRIDRYVDLVLSKDGSNTSTYSYTYDGLAAWTNKDPSRVQVTPGADGNTLTFTPLAIGHNVEVVVPAYVDANTLRTDIHYFFTITQLADEALKIKDFDEAYFAYAGEPVITETADKITLVFSDPDAAGKIQIPENYTAVMDILAVGGGGGGGSPARFGQGGGGGGAGGFTTLLDKRFTANTLNFTVGRGGPGGDGSELGHAYFGLTGEDSKVTDGFDHVYLQAFGGGGGGAPGKSVSNGLNGASGGGAAWYGNIPGAAGQFVAGQGHAGAVPTVSGCGAGGGGASVAGGATSPYGNGLGGAGRASSLSGTEVVYAKGGDGGRNDIDTPATAGVNPGDGGNGGNGGPGGAGANGTVIVTIKKLYHNILVPVPTTNDLITARFLWENGQTMKPFDPQGLSFRSATDSHPYLWSDVIDRIVGTTAVSCSLDTSKPEEQQKVGVGYYNFTIYLKDGFVWDVGDEDASAATAGRHYSWTIVPSWDYVDAAVSVTKKVIWDAQDKSKAIVRIESVSSPELTGGGVPNVLFLGSLCTAHGFSADVLKAALDAITEVGNVDYKFYNSGETTPAAGNSGTLVKGEKFTKAITMKSGNHASLTGFYKGLDDAIYSGKKYDYIVFSFDRGLTATGFNGTYSGGHNTEADIAAWLKPYYDDGAVVWLIDDDPNVSALPFSFDSGSLWFPSQLVQVKMSGSEAYWSSLYYYDNKWGTDSGNQSGSVTGSFSSYRALMGLFDPTKYESVTLNQYQASYRTGGTTYYNYIAQQKIVDAHENAVKALKGAANENQVVYDNAQNVAQMIKSVVKVKPYNLELKDKIMSPTAGLTVDYVTVKAYTPYDANGNEMAEGGAWHDMIRWDKSTGTSTYLDTAQKSGIAGAEMSVDTNNNVLVTFKSVKFEVQACYDTHVTDDGRFRTVSNADEAIYNQSSGLYEKNPNDGAAHIRLLTESGEAIGVESDAETEVPWSFLAYPITAVAVNGHALVGGRNTTVLNVYEGADVTTYYYGNPGYKLDKILLDQVEEPLTAETLDQFEIRNVTAAHTLQVEFVDFRGGTTSAPTNYVYDAKAHVFPVELDDKWDADGEIEIRYALTENGPYYTEEEFIELYSTDPNQTKVGDHTYYYRVFVKQPGYGEDGQPGFVDVGVGGSNTVTITPRPVTVTPVQLDIGYNDHDYEGRPLTTDDFVKPGYPGGVKIEGLLGGDVAVTEGKFDVASKDYQFAEGQYRSDAALKDGVTAAQVVGENYTLVFVPGVVNVFRGPMTIGGVKQHADLNPENPLVDTGVERAVRTYDGVATNIIVRVEDPVATDVVIRYSTDYVPGENEGTWSTQNPAYTHVGTYKVWYSVETKVPYENTTYFFVTNYQYVVVEPRAITVTSATATKMYDGTALVRPTASITEGSLVAGDTIAYNVTGSQTNVGVSPNSFTCDITSRDAAAGVDGNADYTVTKIDGALTVTVAPMNIGGVEQPLDPNFPLPYGETGVLSVEKTYDGIETNIIVNVVRPEDHYTIKYTTDRSDPKSWSETLPTFTEAGSYTVYYAVEDEQGNYAAVTNFARVVIHPAEVVVTADNVGKRADQPDPELTATKTGVNVTGDTAVEMTDGDGNTYWIHTVTVVNAKGEFETLTYTLEREPGNEVGEYPIYAAGDEYQSGKAGSTNPNYHVTYVPGILSIGEGQEVLALWITDHEYASPTEVYLAFLPRGSVGAIDNDYVKNTLNGRIKVRHALTKAGLAAAALESATLRYPATPVEANGWIWIKVTLPAAINVKEPLLWEIVIDDPPAAANP